MVSRVRVATAWLQGCSGCHIAVLDLAETLTAILRSVDVVFSPVDDVRDVPAADVALVEGCVANTNDEELLKRMRDKCKTLVALGTCAAHGGIPAMRNLSPALETLTRCYVKMRGLHEGKVPLNPALPRMMDCVEPISSYVEVDVDIPGCPPTPEMIGNAIRALASGTKPTFPSKNLCVECDRERTRLHTPHRQFLADYVYAPEELEDVAGAPFLLPSRQMFEDSVFACFELDEIDPGKCFLEQGVLCMGPATRQGCKAACLAGNYPCRGCFGPTPNMTEQGSGIMDALACILPVGSMVVLEDLIGTGYRFLVPKSLCRGGVKVKDEEDEG